ncbi:N-acetyltransferase family protein [Microbacterium sp.]|uniref:GNAT family N-acetyltransferase n=1 Tax=Microbacterium sp. TaxID=51671 RepID=UPI003C709FAE
MTDALVTPIPVSSYGAVVRTATPDEHAAVGELTYRGLGHSDAARPDPAREALLRDASARAAEGDLLVAADAATGELLGTASLLRPGSRLSRQARGGEAELRLLAVLPRARRFGAGWALMSEAIERARVWDAPALVLDTGPGNHASQRLYHRLGFQRVPERETLPASRGGHLAVFRYDLRASEGRGARDLGRGRSRRRTTARHRHDRAAWGADHPDRPHR